jgi:hypothetical protein
VARRRSRWPRFSRDAVLFTAGLAGIAHETLLANADRPTLLFVFAAMVGLPAFLHADERDKSPRPPAEDPDPPPKPKPKPHPKPSGPQTPVSPATHRPPAKPRPRRQGP